MIVQCIVCENEFDAEDAASRIETEEEHYFFCSESCREAFDFEPGVYIENYEEAEREPAISA